MVYKPFAHQWLKTKNFLKQSTAYKNEVVKMQTYKFDPNGRIVIPREIRAKYPKNQRFIIEHDKEKNWIILKPIKSIKIELENGAIVEL